jgi:hypothetical protein
MKYRPTLHMRVHIILVAVGLRYDVDSATGVINIQDSIKMIIFNMPTNNPLHVSLLILFTCTV